MVFVPLRALVSTLKEEEEKRKATVSMKHFCLVTYTWNIRRSNSILLTFEER